MTSQQKAGRFGICFQGAVFDWREVAEESPDLTKKTAYMTESGKKFPLGPRGLFYIAALYNLSGRQPELSG
jgi:hypothetical protein